MSLPKTERNKEIISKRLKDPKKWTWSEIGKLYNLDRTRAQRIFRDHYLTKSLSTSRM